MNVIRDALLAVVAGGLLSLCSDACGGENAGLSRAPVPDAGDTSALAADAGPGAVESTQGAHENGEVLVYHPLRIDEHGGILAWSATGSPFSEVPKLAWTALEQAPVNGNGYPTWYFAAMFSGEPGHELEPGPHTVLTQASVAASFMDSALGYYAFSGDRRPVDEIAAPFLQHVLDHGSTAPTDVWASVPYASSNWGDLEYHGADSASCDGNGCGDGPGMLEPDKVGEVGVAALRYWEMSGKQEYLDAAIRCADALASNVRAGTEQQSPWPFRVDAATGTYSPSEYCANTVAPVRLFDELIRTGQGQTSAYAAARDMAWAWMLRYPLQNNVWQNYFEDVGNGAGWGGNLTQYDALETARYLLDHPEFDPEWQKHVESILRWVSEVFGADIEGEPGVQWGAEVISEQQIDMHKMGSHTARFASILSALYEKTGVVALRERAFRSFNWATYMCSDQGVVRVGPAESEGLWFSDGYGDYIRHFLAGMGAVPAWAPPGENHLLRSSSVLRTIEYGDTAVSYSTFDDSGEEVLRLRLEPKSVQAGGVGVPKGDGMPGYSMYPIANGGVAVRIRRNSGRDVVVRL